MKNPSKTPKYCNYSFDDLYNAAFGKNLTSKHKKEFQSLSQEEINKLVLTWAKKAGWKATEVKGDDEIIYISFQPNQASLMVY